MTVKARGSRILILSVELCGPKSTLALERSPRVQDFHAVRHDHCIHVHWLLGHYRDYGSRSCCEELNEQAQCCLRGSALLKNAPLEM